MLERLPDGEAQKQILPTQFGFRENYGTIDALFVARRVMEEIWGMKDGKGVRSREQEGALPP